MLVKFKVSYRCGIQKELQLYGILSTIEFSGVIDQYAIMEFMAGGLGTRVKFCRVCLMVGKVEYNYS